MTRTVVLAPDSFKGSIGAVDAADALAAGWLSVEPDAVVVHRPMADGGEGTLDAFAAAVPGARRMPVRVSGPAGTEIESSWLLLPDATAVVELASTSGIELLGSALRPWDADTRGFGEAIVAALDHGVTRLVLGIGSSASTDGGTGMLRALGADITALDGRPTPAGTRGLSSIARADLSGLRPPPPRGVLVLSDVTNPLLGARGAASVFGAQKGFQPHEMRAANAGLARLAELLPADPAAAGAGAAGGTGFGLLAWGARLAPGAAEVAELIDLRGAIAAAASADDSGRPATPAGVVITGEGSFDGQSAAGKAPTHVAALAAAAGVPVALVAGRIEPDADLSGFLAAASLTDLAGSSAAALADPARWLHEAAATWARSLSG